MRAFIFSLDAFVAFTLTLIAIYSLIFFSSVPSAYYYMLTQAHYLSRDTLLSLSTTACSDDYGECAATGSILDNIVAQSDSTLRENLINNSVGVMVPRQFGYIMEMSDDEGGTWERLYDTASSSADPHAKTSKKLMVATQVMTFGYGGQIRKLSSSPYNYINCTGHGIVGEAGEAAGGAAGTQTWDFGLITCGTFTRLIDNGDGTFSEYNSTYGNTPPSEILKGDLVPSSDVRIVKLTIYI